MVRVRTGMENVVWVLGWVLGVVLLFSAIGNDGKAYGVVFPEPYRLTTDPALQFVPGIYGDNVVWRDMRDDPAGDIWGYNLLTHVEYPICTESSTQYGPDIYGDNVVWEDWRNSVQSDIYGFNLTTGLEYRVPANPPSYLYQDTPAIYGDDIVWQERGLGHVGGEIYGYNLSTEIIYPVCVDGLVPEQWCPAIHGDNVVWHVWYLGGQIDIYGYNPSTGVFPVCTDGATQMMPDIYGDNVVWEDQRNGNWDIYGYNLATGVEYPICTDPSDQLLPAIYGDNVVWSDSRNWGIYGKNLTTGVELPITMSDGVPNIYEDNVVWADDRNGNLDIYIVTAPGMISGQVELQQAVNHSTQITFELRSPGTQDIIANAFNDEDSGKPGTQVTTDSNGNYTLYGVPVGVYDLTAKGRKWLRQKQVNVVSQSWTVTSVDFYLRGGDADDSNCVNIVDLNILKASYGKCEGQPGYDERADFNNSGCVNIQDLSILQSNYGKCGDQ
jgi:beta propeller repeat protein